VADLGRDGAILGPGDPPEVFDQFRRHPQGQSPCSRHEHILPVRSVETAEVEPELTAYDRATTKT